MVKYRESTDSMDDTHQNIIMSPNEESIDFKHPPQDSINTRGNLREFMGDDELVL